MTCRALEIGVNVCLIQCTLHSHSVFHTQTHMYEWRCGTESQNIWTSHQISGSSPILTAAVTFSACLWFSLQLKLTHSHTQARFHFQGATWLPIWVWEWPLYTFVSALSKMDEKLDHHVLITSNQQLPFITLRIVLLLVALKIKYRVFA